MALAAQYGLIGITFLLSLLFSGIIYGWNDIQLVMEREGMYCIRNCGNKQAAVYDQVKYDLIISVAEVCGLIHHNQYCLLYNFAEKAAVSAVSPLRLGVTFSASLESAARPFRRLLLFFLALVSRSEVDCVTVYSNLCMGRA